MSMRDRTLLASLAFGDPDKKDPLHDLGCQYVALSHVRDAMRLRAGGSNHELVADPEEHSRFEIPISKGQGQYKTTIGFIDAILGFRFQFEGVEFRSTETWLSFDTKQQAQSYLEGKRWCEPQFRDGKYGVQEQVRVSTGLHWRPVLCFAEVKIAPVGVGDVLRQINLYREYVPENSWILAAAFDMSEAFVSTLRSAGIVAVHLGEGFRKWASEQRALPSAAVPSL